MQRVLLFYLGEVGEDEEGEGDEDEEGDPPLDDEADHEGHQEGGHVLQDHRYPLRDGGLHVRGVGGEPGRHEGRVVLLLVEPSHIVPQDHCKKEESLTPSGNAHCTRKGVWMEAEHATIRTGEHHPPHPGGQVLAHDAEEVVLDEVGDDGIQPGADVDEHVLPGLALHLAGVPVVEHLDHVAHHNGECRADEPGQDGPNGAQYGVGPLRCVQLEEFEEVTPWRWVLPVIVGVGNHLNATVGARAV